MSPLFRDRLLIALAPESLAALRLERGLRPRVTGKKSIACDPEPREQPWQGAVAALAALAKDWGGRAGDATVVLSNHFVRYALVPWSDELHGGEEEIAYARHCFAKIHGERSKGWEIRLDRGSVGAARVASAVDAPLLTAIGACFPKGGKLRLRSVQPWLMSACNQWRARGGPRSWLLLVEQQRACIAAVEGGRWVAVHSTRGTFDEPSQWAGLLNRERHLLGTAAEQVVVQGHPGRTVPGAPVQGWTFKELLLPPLEGLAAADAAALAMAICAR